MNKQIAISTFFVLLWSIASPNGLHGQFITIQIDVEPDVEATVLRSLNFGSLPAGSGAVAVSLGDGGMGVFSIRAIQTQRLLVSLRQPDYLTHSTMDARIPLHLNIAYTDFGVNDYSRAMEIDGDLADITINPPPDNLNSVWSSAHLYVYGWIDIGNVPEGLYTADIILYIEYE